MSEARNAPRIAAKQRGKAILNGGSQLSCTIRDLSSTGARISFMNPTFLPRQFRLLFDEQDQKVTVVWQAGVLAGVRFHTPIRGLPARQAKRWPWSRR